MKKTLDQVESMKAKAARFLRNVLGDDDRAEEVEDESPEDYAGRKRIQIINSNERKNNTVPRSQTKAELVQEIRNLQDENEELQDRIDAIFDLVCEDSDEDDEEDDSDDDQD